MVLTGLYPFNKAVPKIRYMIGDLVEAVPPKCKFANIAYRFLSRQDDAIPEKKLNGQSGVYRVFSTDVAEVLAPLPDVARKSKTGFLKFSMIEKNGAIVVTVELTYHPALYKNRIAELTTQIIAGLKNRRETGDLRINFVAPNTLDKIIKL
jgi:phenylacetate-coenzyme A ligase PaaK-like adenylate-forming protein